MKTTINIDGKEVNAAEVAAAFALIAAISGGASLLTLKFWNTASTQTFGVVGKKVATAFIAVAAAKAVVEVSGIVSDFVMSRAKPAQSEEN